MVDIIAAYGDSVAGGVGETALVLAVVGRKDFVSRRGGCEESLSQGVNKRAVALADHKLVDLGRTLDLHGDRVAHDVGIDFHLDHLAQVGK